MIIKTYKNNKCTKFIIDDADYEKIKEWDYSSVDNGSNMKYLRLSKNCEYYMIYTYFHRFIMDCPTNMIVDHINGNTLDNRKSNLRLVSEQQNRWNTQKVEFYKNKKKTSQYIGVYWYPPKNRWKAVCGGIYLGLFNDEKKAAYAYDTYCRKNRGEYAKLNFPNEMVEVDVVRRKGKYGKNSNK